MSDFGPGLNVAAAAMAGGVVGIGPADEDDAAAAGKGVDDGAGPAKRVDGVAGDSPNLPSPDKASDTHCESGFGDSTKLIGPDKASDTSSESGAGGT